MRKENVKRSVKIYSWIILILLYIAIVSFPFSALIPSPGGYIVDICLKVAFLVVAFISINKYQLSKLKIFPDKNVKLLLLIPLLVLTFSNWIYVWIFKSPLAASVNGGTFTLSIFITLLTVFCEELIFREVTHDVLKGFIKQDYLRILISSLIFALLHFLNIFNGWDILTTLAQVGYTFVLGLVLGLIKEKGVGLIALISFHLLFNFLNNDLFSQLYKGTWGTNFIITNVIIGALVVSYGILMYFLLKVKSTSFDLEDNGEN